MKQFYFSCLFMGITILFLSCSIVSIRETNTLEDITSQLDEQFNERVGKNIPGAVILFISDGEIYYRQAFGYRNRENLEKMTADTIFQVASISKPISAFGLMKLVEDGQLSLYEPVENYLRRWQIPDSKHQTQNVNIAKLLSHTAGTSVGGYAGYPPDIGLPTVEQSLSGNPDLIYRRYHRSPVILKREPGRRFVYSGGGTTVLQLAAEEVTGKSFSEYMSLFVFGPMNLKNSSFVYSPEIKPGPAIPYNSFLSPIPNFLFIEQAAAGLYTTADDLAIIIIELIKCYHGEENNFIISRDTLVSMLEPVAPCGLIFNLAMGGKTSVGLGLFITDMGAGRKTYGHGGSNQGWKVHFEISPDTKDGIIVLTNGDRGRRRLINPLLAAWRKYVKNK